MPKNKATKKTPMVLHSKRLLDFEKTLWSHSLTVAGVDEAGAGPLAGPVTAACVALHPSRTKTLEGLNDSKQLQESERDRLRPLIQDCALAWAVAHASVEEIDRLNIRQATLLAMRRAVEAVRGRQHIDHLLVDAHELATVPVPQSPLIDGDARSLSIAAASVLAKTARDALMVAYDQTFPGYGFSIHKGYGTKQHRDALVNLGPCEIHRRTFAPVRQILEAATGQ